MLVMLANPRKQINISLTVADYTKIVEIAKAQDRTPAYIVRGIVLNSINGPDNTNGPTQPL